MLASVSNNQGTLPENFGIYKKEQVFTYTSPATSIGKGDRSNPNMFMPHWTPAPNNYDVVLEAKDNNAPKFK